MPKTDVFIRVFSSDEMRLGFAIATVARWKMQKDVRVVPIIWGGGKDPFRTEWVQSYILHNTPYMPFSTRSLQIAEEQATSDPYIICNDDNLPYGQDFVRKGLSIMERHPDFGIISGMVTNDVPYPDDWPEVKEIHAVGGLVFIRKGLVTEFPPLEDAHWDGERHAQIIGKGFKSGTTRELPYLHMGAKFSIANPAHYVGA